MGQSLPQALAKIYSFDTAGNRKNMTVASAVGPTIEQYTVEYEYDKNNRLLKERNTPFEAGPMFETIYSYDPNGNQIQKQVGSTNETETRAYDVFNRLKGVNNGNISATYAYRPDGLRLSKTAAGLTTTHIWDGGNIVAELDGTGNMTNRYVRGINLIKWVEWASERFYLFNAHGDVVQLTTSEGIVSKNYYYDAFGNEVVDDANPFRFTGGEYFDLSCGITTIDVNSFLDSAEMRKVAHPISRELMDTIVLPVLPAGKSAWSAPLYLKTDTTYVLEFEYWSDEDNSLLVAGLHNLSDEQLWASKTVQKHRVEIRSSNPRMEEANLLFYGNADYQQGTVYVTNVRFYNKETVENEKYIAPGNIITTTKNFSTWQAGIRDIVKPGGLKPVKTIELYPEIYYSVGHSQYLALSTDTTYIMEFSYWADNDGDRWSVDMADDNHDHVYFDSTGLHYMSYTANQTVQSAKLILRTSDPRIVASQFRLIAEPGNKGNVYVSDIVLYREDSLGAVPEDSNPFRFAAEYWDGETGTYYLRNRYYSPATGRFLAADTHWNLDNMIYGSNPVTINEGKDPLGLTTYTYRPNINAIRQSTNLYVYCANNPISYFDPSGKDMIWITAQFSAPINIPVLGTVRLGHTSAVVQNANGEWHYFYWGKDHAVLVKVDPDSLNSLGDFNKWLGEDLAPRGYVGTTNYTHATYIEGDTTAAFNYFSNLVGSNANNFADKNSSYNQFINNCLHQTLYGLAKSDNRIAYAGDIVGFVPNHAATVMAATYKNTSFNAPIIKDVFGQKFKSYDGGKTWI